MKLQLQITYFVKSIFSLRKWEHSGLEVSEREYLERELRTEERECSEKRKWRQWAKERDGADWRKRKTLSSLLIILVAIKLGDSVYSDHVNLG